MRDFYEGSELLENGDAGLGVGTRLVEQGTTTSCVAYMPVAMTPDGKGFVWCVFDAGVDDGRCFRFPMSRVASFRQSAGPSYAQWLLELADPPSETKPPA